MTSSLPLWTSCFTFVFPTKRSVYLFWDKIDRIITLNEHQGFVKGLTWDPVGKYLASQVADIFANLTGSTPHFVQ